MSNGESANGRTAWPEIVARVARSRNVLLVLHVHPDGDSVGCSLAMARCLRALGKRAQVVAPDPLPANLRFLDPDGVCVPPEGATGPFDLGLFLDCADVERVGSAQSLVPSLPEIVNIDHHSSNRGYGTLNFIDASAGACGEIALRLIDALGWQLDAQAATALFTALTTDTGSFRYENTHPDTLRIAARLVEAGADLPEVSNEIWDSRSLASLTLLSLVLPTLRLEGGGRLASLAVTQAMVGEAGAVAGDLEGLVDYPRSLRGVEVAMLCSEERSGSVRVSLRSNRCLDVSQLAARFGGGGHVRAAGCTVAGALAAVRDRVTAAALEALAAAASPPA